MSSQTVRSEWLERLVDDTALKVGMRRWDVGTPASLNSMLVDFSASPLIVTMLFFTAFPF